MEFHDRSGPSLLLAGLLLVLTPLASAGEDLPTPDEIFNRARVAMGGSEKLADVWTLTAIADCTGPRGDFQTVVHSGGDRRVAFEQRRANAIEFRTVVVDDVGWSPGASSRDLRVLSPEMISMVRGHELHMMVLDVDRRFHDPATVGVAKFNGAPCTKVAMTDDDGSRVFAYYRQDDGMPAGFNFLDQGGKPTTIVFESWTEVDGIRLVETLTLRRGDDVFTYDYREIRLNDVDESLFRVPEQLHD